MPAVRRRVPSTKLTLPAIRIVVGAGGLPDAPALTHAAIAIIAASLVFDAIQCVPHGLRHSWLRWLR